VIDLTPLQDAWATLRGRGPAALRRELAETAFHLARVRALADGVRSGAIAPQAAHGALMRRRYPSVRMRAACAEQLGAFVYADVARVWIDDARAGQLAAHRTGAATAR
jgi:hypothetical protein